MESHSLLFYNERPDYKDAGALVEYVLMFINDALSESTDSVFSKVNKMEQYGESENVPYKTIKKFCDGEIVRHWADISTARKILRQINGLIEYYGHKGYIIEGVDIPKSMLPRKSGHKESKPYYNVLTDLWNQAIKLRRSARLNTDNKNSDSFSENEEDEDDSFSENEEEKEVDEEYKPLSSDEKEEYSSSDEKVEEEEEEDEEFPDESPKKSKESTKTKRKNNNKLSKKKEGKKSH